MAAERKTVPLMMLPGAGTLGCSLPPGHRSASNPAVLTDAMVNGCPVSAQMLRLAVRTVPDRWA